MEGFPNKLTIFLDLKSFCYIEIYWCPFGMVIMLVFGTLISQEVTRHQGYFQRALLTFKVIQDLLILT
jgi:hypothetical protein